MGIFITMQQYKEDIYIYISDDDDGDEVEEDNDEDEEGKWDGFKSG